MVKDIIYIIKRVIIGILIVLILGYLRSHSIIDVKALQVDSYPIGQYSTVIDNLTTTYTYNISGHPWSSLPNTYGYINGSIGIYKVSGGATDANVMPLMVYVNSGNYNYPCSINSVSMENSTYNGGSYSYRCPIRMTSSGITSISVQFEALQLNSISQYRLAFGSLISYEIHEEGDVNVNVDTNGVISESQTQGNATRDTINNSTNSIINNQNNNTDKEIESQKVCKFYDKNAIVLNDYYINGNTGFERNDNNFGITDYINIENSTIELLTVRTGAAGACFYNINKTLISCIPGDNMTIGYLTIPTGASYFRSSINTSENKPTFKVCRNGNQAISDSVNDLNNTLKDDTGGEVSSSWFSQFEDNSNSPVSDLLTMPITLLQAYVNGISSSCTPFNIGNLYGTNIVFPCIDLEDYLGSGLWSIIDSLCCIFLCYNIGMMCISIYESITSLDDNMQLLYSPQHANSRVARNGGTYNG